MGLDDFLAGAAFFIPMLAASLTAAALVLRRRYDYLRGSARLVGFALLATCVVLFAHVIPATLGILYRGTPLVTSLLLLAAAYALRERRVTESPGAALEAPSSGTASTGLAVLAVAAAAVIELARLRLFASQPLTFIDALGFHLPGVARWIHSGTIWQIDQFEPGFATGQYPNNGDFLSLAVALPWHDLAFVRITQGLFYGLTGVGTYALARQLRSTRAAAAILAAVVITIPAISDLGFEGLPDNVTLSMLAIGLVFLVRYERSRLQSDLLLGGLGLGVSFGAKWYGVTTMAVVVVVWLVVWLARRRGVGTTIRDIAKLVGMIAVGGGIWLVRNVIESGNPIYPKAVKLLGTTVFPGSRNDLVDKYGYSIASYLGHPSILRKYIWPGFKLEVGVAGLVIVAGLIVVAIYATRALRRPRRSHLADHTTALALVAVTVGVCVLYSITPGTAYGPKNLPVAGYQTIRWLMPAAVIGCAVTAAGVRYLGRAGLLLELAAIAGLVDSIHLDQRVAVKYEVEAGVVLLVLAAIVWLARAWGALLREQLVRPVGALAAAPVVVLVAVGLLRFQESHFDRHSYATYDSVYAYIDQNASSGHRIGITGSVNLSIVVPVLPAMGPRLGNYVAFVGDKVVHSLAAPSSEKAFAAELRNGHYDLLLVGLQDTYHADRWAPSLGYRLIVRSPRLALYVAPGKAVATRS